MVNEKNVDQSSKSNGGNKYNQIVSSMMSRIHNGSTIIFVKNEPKFRKSYETNGWIGEDIIVTMDHWILIVDDKKKSILSINTDGTTTVRSGRLRGKSAECAHLHEIHDVVEKCIFKRYPKFVGYDVFHIGAVLFPAEINQKLKNYTSELKQIKKTCVSINYHIHPDATRQNDGIYGIDAAMNEHDFADAVIEIAAHPEKYNFSSTILADVWKKQHPSLEYCPPIELSMKSMQLHKDHLLWCLDNNKSAYKKVTLNNFLVECGIDIRKSATNAERISIIKQYIN